MSRQGKIEEFQVDSSEIVVAEAVSFLEQHRAGSQPMFAVIWFGTPHSPFRALEADKGLFSQLNEASANHYGELAAMDRSIGTLRRRLRELGIANDTLLVFCSDNGGLGGITPETVGGLRGTKGTIFEGGLRVPGIIEWPAVIKTPRITQYPACTMDLFPTVADVLSLPTEVMVQPVDGRSLKPLFTADLPQRDMPIPFRYQGRLALVDNRYKLLSNNPQQGSFQLYDLQSDPAESRDIAAEQPAIAARLKKELLAWNESVDASFAGNDYPQRRVSPPDPAPIQWTDHPDYAPYLPQWRQRPEYRRPATRGGRR
jgi:arylsulfatase A-like enzyme